MRVPQIVCYAMSCGKVVSLLRRMVLKVPYVSLVNLIGGEEIVPELVAGDMTVKTLKENLRSLLADETYRNKQKQGYEAMMLRLGAPGAPDKAAELIVND